MEIKSGAQPNVLGEAKFLAENRGLLNRKATFEDEHGNYIAIEPMSKEVHADFTKSELSEDRFASLPTSYEMYKIEVETTTSAHLDFIENWHSSQKIILYNRFYPNDDVMERVSRVQQLNNLVFAVSK